MTADVTVIVATHDRPAMLEVGLHSILASAAMVPETVRVLVIDDASSDGAAATIANRCRVDYRRNATNIGIGATLARGFDESDSPFTVFWGDDDYMLPRFMPLHLAAMTKGHDVVYSSYYLADHNLRMGREMRLPLITFRDVMRGQVNATDQAMFRRASLDGIPWRPERERAMLMTMWLALTGAGKDIATIREATWLYRRHEAQLSHVRPSPHDQALRDAAIAEYREGVAV